MFLIDNSSEYNFVCLFVYCFLFIRYVAIFFTFDMNVSECTPQSVGDIFWPRKKRDCLYVYIYIG